MHGAAHGARQKHNAVGDLVREDEALDGRVFEQESYDPLAFGNAADERRLDVAGADGIDADAVRAVVDAVRLGEADDGYKFSTGVNIYFLLLHSLLTGALTVLGSRISSLVQRDNRRAQTP